MENAVYYLSRNKEGEKSKKDDAGSVAGAIAAGAQTSAYAISKHTFVSNTDILFIGCEVSGGKIPGKFRDMLKKLQSEEVKYVALFSVIKSGTQSALNQIKPILESRGLKICNEEFSCPGSSMFKNKGCPTEEDFKKAREFGAMILSKYRKL